MRPAEELDADGPPRLGEAAGHRQHRAGGQRDREGDGDPVDSGVEHLASEDFDGFPLHAEQLEQSHRDNEYP